jgi:hypothetical protein
MAKLTIGIGLLLILVGGGFFAGLAIIEHKTPSATALIPAFAGLPILLLGFVALKDAYRMHAMHGVAILALLGFLLPAGRLGMKLAQGATVPPTILVSLILMAVLCLILLVACVRSFVLARLRRAADANE